MMIISTSESIKSGGEGESPASKRRRLSVSGHEVVLMVIMIMMVVMMVMVVMVVLRMRMMLMTLRMMMVIVLKMV